MLDAMVFVVAERGFAGTTIGAVCAQARVSRGTFYEEFDGLRECLLAVMDDGYERVRALIVEAFAGEGCWQDGVRAALASLLAAFDAEPLLARVWFIEVLGAGSWALERRERHVRALTLTIVTRWPLPDGADVNPLAAAGVMESVLGIIHTRLLTRGGERSGEGFAGEEPAGATPREQPSRCEQPLLELLGPLMGLATAPYLDRSAVAEEIERSSRLACAALAGRDMVPFSCEAGCVQIPSFLGDARARRARDCLRHLAEHPGVSNRQIAAAVGIMRDTHISTLLARLHRMGLIVKRARRPGGPNAWSLSPDGRRVLIALQARYERAPHAGDHAAGRA
jgi:AcrR family transcriptional regulator